MIDRQKIAERLRIAREKKFATAREAAEWLGIPYPTYSGNENGTTTFSLEAAANYARRFHVSLDWLIYGRGRGPATEVDDQVAELYAMIADFDRWPEPEQRQAVGLLKVVAEEVRRKTVMAPTS